MRIRTVAVVALLFVGMSGPAPAQPEAVTPQLLEDVAGIHRALDRLVGLLETMQANQRIDIVLKRIALRERRLEPLEDRLKTAESTALSLGGEISRLETMVEQQEEVLGDEIRRGLDQPSSGTRRGLDELRMILRIQSDELDEAESRVRGLEDAMARGRDEIAILDEMLLEMLE